MDLSEKNHNLSRDGAAAFTHRIDDVSKAADECLHSKYAPEVIGVGAAVVLVATRGRLAGLAEKIGLAPARAFGFSEKLAGEAGEIESMSGAGTLNSFSSIKRMRQSASVDPTSFAGRTGVRFASKANGKWFDFKIKPDYLNMDRNSELFQREVSRKLGVDLEKMREGKVAILYPRFKNPAKKLLGKAVGDVGVWGDQEQGVGVVEYESLPSAKGFLKGANSVVRVTQRAENSLPANYASHAASGVFVGRPEQGLVLTNEHVVDSAASISVETLNGQRYAAKVLRVHPTQDMAMLQITDAPAQTSFPVATLADSETGMLKKSVASLGHHGALPGLIASPGKYEEYSDILGLDVLTLDSLTKGGSGGGIFGQDGRLVSLATRQLNVSDQAIVKRSFAAGINIKDIRGFIDQVDAMLSAGKP
jgi:hypothetical protein